MSRTATNAGNEHFELLLTIDLDIAALVSHWAYCDRISSYVARMISHNRADSQFYANLFSSAFNELLETAYRMHGPTGDFTCSVSRSNEKDRIELTIPCETGQAAFYHEAMLKLSRDDVEMRYRAALFADGPIEPDVGLLELVADYDADISIEDAGTSVRLTADLSLEGLKL